MYLGCDDAFCSDGRNELGAAGAAGNCALLSSRPLPSPSSSSSSGGIVARSFKASARGSINSMLGFNVDVNSVNILFPIVIVLYKFDILTLVNMDELKKISWSSELVLF